MTFYTKTLAALIATTALSVAASASAQDNGWSGEAALTGSQTSGNTDTTDVGFALKLKKETDLWRHNLYGTADFGRANGENNKERFTLGYKLDRDITDRLYAFGNGDYYRDEFGAFEDGYFLGAGLGYKLVLPQPLEWDVEAGLGYRSQSPQVPGITGDFTQADFDLAELNGDFDRSNDLALRGASKINYVLNDNVSLYNNSEVIYSSSDTYLWNEFGVTATLMGNLAARASFRLDHHTDVIGDLENTDTITRFGIVYTIK